MKLFQAMTHSDINNKILLKRRSSSVNIKREQKQKRSDLSSSTDINRTTPQISSTLILFPKQNVSMQERTTAIRPNIITSQRRISGTLPSMYILLCNLLNIKKQKIFQIFINQFHLQLHRELGFHLRQMLNNYQHQSKEK